ncbi:MAG: Elongation factor Ts [candidate division WWE3 bacterium GW2011_GWF2_41_45]|uniref:Elongation factor Ts n=3 Tax=Katanobacteria TaxID=422282 RepID=A0A1F4W224_UNCKA|nr:MAG: Elongation factor Ts [candidate division WWE3 bacterium GW2011_GWC2_41_23]KKS10146.1 MAG: Elongation factor Ts [candidate division WWE3 bacterium GW2011_GWF2_41_45]KKS19929.1 MAG: Elongation factor Ts [candidate division WWE3 bacterium GW2011_GWE1_41_72]KKS28241.1 MAG: Elongation factor Ts [candidate division WWE3 bacterium GW2011_GWC1_42_102]KKS28991.1 MAG: Elongation factor Ts [candidate division WWE3 bacterium GW2011_GWD2_42_11]KKS50587.1 MAG: Elongation factor Ts [candidate divisio
MELNIKDIKNLREETGAGVLEVKQALENFAGDYTKAKEELMKKVGAKAAKKSERVTKDGLIFSYLHAGGRVGTMIYMACETDFVAKTEDFQKLCKEVAMQAATGDYSSVEDLLNDEYIREPSKKISDLLNEVTAKVGEKIELKKFIKYSVGED